MLNVRGFNDNPLLSKIRYEVGKALSGKVYSKDFEKFKPFSNRQVNLIDELNPLVYYGLFVKIDDINRLEKYNNDISSKDGYINFYNYISLLVLEEVYEDNEVPHINFLLTEVFEYLEYRESVHSLLEYYFSINSKVNHIMKDDDILSNPEKPTK